MKAVYRAGCRAFGLAILLIALASGLPFRAAWASPDSAPPSATGALQVVSSPSDKPSPDPAVYHAGIVDPLNTPTLQHTFLLKNTSATPILIEQLTSSCSCTTGAVTANGHPQTLPLTLAPGQIMGVDVQVAVENSAQGVLTKYVWIAAQGQKDPAATLEITADFPPLVVLMPPTLDLGTVRAGEGATAVVTALISPQIKLGETIPDLTSTLPYLSISPPAAAGTGKAPTTNGASWPKLAYTVTLAKDSPIGPFLADLDVQLTHLGPLGRVTEQSLPNPFVVARGSVVGDISVEPKNLVFGTVEQGKGATKSVTITAMSPTVLAGLIAKSNSLSITVRPAVGLSPGGTAVYEIAIGKSAQAGICEAKVIFATADGQVLELPVLAYVTAGSAH